MRINIIGFDGEGLHNEIDGDDVVFHLKGDHTKKMQGDRLVGVCLQYLLINPLSLRQAARSVMLHAQIYGLLDS